MTARLSGYLYGMMLNGLQACRGNGGGSHHATYAVHSSAAWLWNTKWCVKTELSQHVHVVQRCKGRWHKSLVKYWSQGRSGQAIKLFQAPQKISLTFQFWLNSFILDDVKLAVIQQVSNERMWHFSGQNVLWSLQHIFRNQDPRLPGYIYAPGKAGDQRAVRACLQPKCNITELLIDEVEAVVVIAGEQLRSDNKTNVQRTAHVSVDH